MSSFEGSGGRPGAPSGQYVTAGQYEPIVLRPNFDVATPGWSGGGGHHGEEQTINLLDLWHVILKRRMVVIGAFVAALTIGLAATMLMTRIYTATTEIQIDREAAKVVDVEGVTPAEMLTGEEFFQTQYGLLKSRSLAARVVDDLGLAQDNKFIERMGGPGLMGAMPRTPDARRRRAISLVMSNLSVKPDRGSRLVALSFDSPDAALSATVVNGLAEAYIEQNLQRRYESASYARRFLEDRLKQVKDHLEDSERQLVAYATAQQIINIAPQPGEDGGAEQVAGQSLTAADLVAMNAALAQARTDRIRAQERWREAQAGDGSSLPEVLQNPTIQTLREQKAALEAQYQDKLKVYTPDFPSMIQLKAQIDELDRQISQQVKAVRDSIRGQYEIAAHQEASLSGQVTGLKSGVMDLRNRSIQYNILQREVDTNRTLYDGLLQRYKEVGIAGGVGTNNVSVVDRATTPTSPSRPIPLLNMALAAFLGLLVGVLAAVVLEMLDQSIQSPEDVETKIGIPLLGTVPVLEKGQTVEEALSDARSAFSEAYYSIRTALQFSTPTGVPQTLLVTSSQPAEGKSTTALTIAQNFARVGLRVLLVDADLRNPSLHRQMSGDSSRGLSNVLAGSNSLDEVVQNSSTPLLFFVPCGPLPPNPAELLAGENLHAMLARAQAEYDLIIMDGPPVLGLADAPILASASLGVLMVVQAASARRAQVKTALRRLSQGGRAKVLGAILTKFNAKRASYGYGYHYGYDYNYGAQPALPGRE